MVVETNEICYYMKQYKGIIFNSVNVGLLNGELGRVVSANNIRTAVVSRKTRTEGKKFMKARGISVDVVIGGHNLDTRYKQFGKPNESERLRMGCRYLGGDSGHCKEVCRGKSQLTGRNRGRTGNSLCSLSRENRPQQTGNQAVHRGELRL